MSVIRVYLDPAELRYVDVADGYTMLIGDENVLEVYDDVDVVLAMFRTWDHAVSIEEHSAVLLPLALAADDEDEDEEDEDEDEEDEEDEDEEDDLVAANGTKLVP